jgi:hypothetical protein
MVNWLRQLIAKVRKKELFDCKHGRSCVEKKVTQKLQKVTPKRCKKVTTNVHYCSADGGREVGFVRACVRRRRNSKLDVQTFQLDSSKRFVRSSNISARRQNVSCVRQTFQLGVKTFRAFVKHFSSTSNISAWRSARLGKLICRDVDFFAERTNERINERTNERTHIFQSNFFSQMFLYLMYPNCLSFIWC